MEEKNATYGEWVGPWHIMPLEGPLHKVDINCWCCPDINEEGTVTHREVEDG